MINLILGAVLIAIIGAAIMYIHKEHKRGTKCIGCPAGGSCGKKNACGCEK